MDFPFVSVLEHDSRPLGGGVQVCPCLSLNNAAETSRVRERNADAFPVRDNHRSENDEGQETNDLWKSLETALSEAMSDTELVRPVENDDKLGTTLGKDII